MTPDQLTNTYTPAQLHTAYGTAALRADGMTGRGTRMTVLSLGQAFSPQLVAYAAQCFGYRAPRIQTVAADGVQGRLPVLGLGSEDESLLDLQVVAPILTGASSVRIVETPEAANLVESMVNGMATALNADGRGTASPDVVSVSYGECLDVTGATDAALGALGTFAVAEDLPVAMEQIQTLLRERHHLKPGQPDDFVVRDMTEFSKALGSTTETMTRSLLFVALVSLLVGGVGIMNIMLVSVTERTREIGLRMAVGATPPDILRQFLLEALVLSLVGGLLGILAGRGTALFMNHFWYWPIQMSVPVIAISIAVCAGIGVAFGYYPAWKASRLDPIDALRYE